MKNLYSTKRIIKNGNNKNKNNCVIKEKCVRNKRKIYLVEVFIGENFIQ